IVEEAIRKSEDIFNKAFDGRGQDEEFLRQYAVGLSFLSSAAIRMLGPMGLSELFRLISNNLYSIGGGALVTFSEFDFVNRKVIVRELRSTEEERKKLVNILGQEPENLMFDFPDEIRSRMIIGGLDCLEGGFYDLVFGQLPKTLCNILEQELNIKSVFAMACAVEDDILGTVSILTHEHDCVLQNKNLIESVVNQGALALKRRKAEDALRESETRLSAFFDNAESIFWIKDLQGRFIAVNHYTADILGKTKEQILGKTVHDIHGKEFADQYSKNDQTVLLSGQSMVFEETTELTDGLHTMVSVKFPLFNSNNSIYAIGAICTDFTERILAELQLKEKKEEIEAQNEEYLQLNEELRQTNEELQIAKEHAEQSDHLKTAFLQNMSHEIRTPMNAIMGFAQLLPEQYGNKDKLEHFSKIINQRCSDLLDIINDILDISKIESGQAPVHMENCKLALLLSEISIFFSEFQKRHNKQHIAFHIQVHPDLSNQEIRTDKVKLKQILINLLGNALKFTDAGEIRLGCKPDGRHHLLFYVSDTGIGIPNEKKDFIFERFAQLEQTPHHLYGGTGLGLSIVKGLVDLLGGNIWVESELNKGSTFFFSLPYEKAFGSSHAQIPVEIHEKFNFSNKTILIVEDDIYNTAYLKEILDGTGAKILHSVYAKEAIEIMKSRKPDIVLIDIRLPDMDGYTVTQLMKKHDPYLRIIAQTAYAANEDRERAIEVGCSDFISKPIKREVLLSMIDKQLSGR
ncbi:MAG TPA: ATP-binding protein, partial [Bacteroidales bacterium]|nr:ATP-binding protein [Bacteroidales bacterium]